MSDISTITIRRDTYKTQEDFENAIKKAIMVLLDNNYIMTVRYDEPGLGIVVIEFNHDDQSWGAHYPYWLSPEEEEGIIYDDEREENV